MKKFAQIALLSSVAMTAAHADLTDLGVTEVPTQPVGAYVNVDVYKTIDNVLHPTKSSQISRSDRQQQLCWTAVSDVAIFKNMTNVKETFRSPVGATFNDKKSVVQSSIDGTRHTVSTPMTGIAGGTALERCWVFDPTDPVGEYSIFVEVDGTPIVDKKFTVVP